MGVPLFKERDIVEENDVAVFSLTSSPKRYAKIMRASRELTAKARLRKKV
jgi:hypothetical protein